MKKIFYAIAFAVLAFASGCSKEEQNPDLSIDAISAKPDKASQVFVSTFAGNLSGEGIVDGQGTSAGFEGPAQIAADGNGNFFIADDYNDFLRHMTGSAVVTTPRTFNETDPNVVYDMYFGMFIHGGGLYFVDMEHSRVRKLVGNTKYTLYDTGEGTGGSLRPGIVVDRNGAVYFFQGYELKKLENGALATVAGQTEPGFRDGSGTQALFSSTQGMAIDAAGNIYVCDLGNQRIRKITPAGLVSTVAGNGAEGFADGPSLSASFNWPMALAIDPSGNIYVTDGFNNSIRKISVAGTVSTIAGGKAGGYKDGPGKVARFDFPHGIVLSGDNLYVGDSGNNMIRKISLSGKK